MSSLYPDKLPPISNNFNPKYVEYNPGLYAAINAGKPSGEDAFQMAAIQYAQSKHAELNNLKDVNQARTQFSKLSSAIQQSIIKLNPDYEYQENPNYLSRVGTIFKEGVLNAYKMPFQMLGKAATGVINTTVRTPYNIFTGTADALAGDSTAKDFATAANELDYNAALSYITSAKSWKTAWTGEDNWREKDVKELDQTHGRGLSFLIRNQIDGKKPGDIYREYGGFDLEMQSAISAQSDYNTYLYGKATNQTTLYPLTNAGKAYQNALNDIDSKHKEFGNDFYRFFNATMPPEKAGIIGQLIYTSFANPLWATYEDRVAAGIESKKTNTWRQANPNPFSKGPATSDPSGFLQFQYELFADPLTWVTGGGSKGLALSQKLAKNFNDAGAAGVSNEIRVGDLFQNEKFSSIHQRFVDTINDLRIARDTKNPASAFVAREKIKQDFPQYDNDVTIKHFLETKVLNRFGDEVNVTDLESLKSFFIRGEMIDYITHGHRHNIGYYNDNHVMLERSSRIFTDKVRSTFEKVFNGLDRSAPNGMVAEETLEARLNIVLNAFKDSGKYGDEYSKSKEVKDTVDSLAKHGNAIQKSYSRFLAAHPSNVVIHTSDEFVDGSLNAFRDFARVLTGDKAAANFITEIYLSYSPDDRFNMLYTMYKYYTDKIGLSSQIGGVRKQREYLEETFGDVGGFGPVANFQTPAHLAKEGEIRVAPGASQPLHLTRGISMMDFNRVHKDLYELSEFGPLKFIKALSYGNYANIINGLWTLGNLFPKIAVKGATDEAVLNSLANSYKSIFAILTRKGAAASTVRAAFTGNPETLGVIKTKVRKSNSPHLYITPAKRVEMQADVRVSEDILLPSGRLVKKDEWVSADEFHGGTYLERLAAVAIAKYGGKLSDAEKKYLADELANNSHSMHAHALSSVARTLGNHDIEGSIVSEMYGKSQLSLGLDIAHVAERGLKNKVIAKIKGTDVLRQTGKFRVVDYDTLSQTEKTIAHFTFFYQYFARNVWTHKPTKVAVDYGDIFIKNNALRTAKDGEGFVDDVMNQIGFQRNSLREWQPRLQQIGVEPDGTLIITDKISKETIKAFVTSVRSASDMRAAGLSVDQIAEAIIRNSRDELYTVFHGGPDVFNENLLNLVNFKLSEAATKLSSRKSTSRTDTEDVSLVSSREKYETNLTKPSYHISQIAFNEFEEITSGYGLLAKEIKTDLNFKSLAPNLTVVSAYENMARFPWEIMDRQLNDLYRTDAYMVKVFENRNRMAPAEKEYVSQLVERGTEYDAAVLQATMVFSGQASINAVHGVMKYADNTNVRSQLAWMLRGVGRFNRANEDFWRRLIRLTSDRGIQTLYRLGHYQLAMDGTGFVHTDDDGNKYIILPNDGVTFRTINNVFTILLNPINTARAILDGERETIFKQPEWSQKTLKLSMLNPSYSESAGVVSLHGATMGLTVEGLKKLFKVSGFEKQGEELDNYILGPVSDNQTLSRILPQSIHNVWAGLDSEHKTAAWANAIQQAGMFLQFNDSTKMEPKDYQDQAKVRKYYDRLGIAAYNIIAVKAGFNILSAAPMGDTVDGVNPLLRDAGIVTFTSEFNDILRAVVDVNAEDGFPLSEPIAVALAMFVGSFPDRLVFTVNRDSLGAKLYINAVKETKNWVFDNKKMIERYGSAAFVFAPKPENAEYDPATVKFLQATGIIEPKNNPFITDKNSDTPLTRYIKELASVKDRAKFYDLDRFYQAAITDPSNLRRNDPGYIAELKAQVDYQKIVLKEGNPMLAYTLGTSEVISRELLQKNFTDIKFLVTDADFTSTKGKVEKGKINPSTQKQIKIMLNIASTMLLVFEDTNIRRQAEGIDTLNQVYKDGIENLSKLSLANPYAGAVYTNIIKPLLDDVYRIPTKGLK